MSPKKPTFEEAAAENGIKSDTVLLLQAQQFDTLIAMTIMEKEDVDAMDISKPQKGILKR